MSVHHIVQVISQGSVELHNILATKLFKIVTWQTLEYCQNYSPVHLVLDLEILILSFFKNVEKSGGLILSLEKFDLILYFNFLQKFLCSKTLKYRIKLILNQLEYEIKPNFSKDRIRPPVVFFSAFLKKITPTRSSHFLSPTGQGLCCRNPFLKGMINTFLLCFLAISDILLHLTYQ